MLIVVARNINTTIHQRQLVISFFCVSIMWLKKVICSSL